MMWPSMACVPAVLLACVSASAQCGEPQWFDTPPVPGVASVGATWGLTTLPNGDVIAGGIFAIAGDSVVDSVARWDGHAWSPVGQGLYAGEGFYPAAYAFCPLDDGAFVCGGWFTHAGGVEASNIALWTGSTWEDLDYGMNSSVTGVCALPNGDLVACGEFEFAGNSYAPYIARYDVVERRWVDMGGGLDAPARTLTCDSQGRLYVCGDFYSVNEIPAYGLASWKDGEWSVVGDNIEFAGLIAAMAVLPNGNLVVGGGFSGLEQLPPEAWNLAQFDGQAWTAIGNTGPDNEVRAITILADGNLAIAGLFAAVGDVPADGVAIWDGSAWSGLGEGIITGQSGNYVGVLTPLGEHGLVAGGEFTLAGDSFAKHIASWNGTRWSQLGPGKVHELSRLVLGPAGEVYGCGSFASAAWTAIHGIARKQGDEWLDLGVTDGSVTSAAVLPDGRVVACGGFSTDASLPTYHVAIWGDGEWTTLGGIMDRPIECVVPMPDGTIVAGGMFRTIGGLNADGIARWDGSAWAELGGGVALGAATVNDAIAMPDGTLVIAGSFLEAGGVPLKNIARWDGAAWSAIGAGLGARVRALAVMPDGGLIAGGSLKADGNGNPLSLVARWDGSNWADLDGGVSNANSGVFDLAPLANGDLVVVGDFTLAGGDVLCNGLALWQDSNWYTFGQGANDRVTTVIADVDQTLFFGGRFTMMDGIVASHFAQFGCDVPCPADFNGDGSVNIFDFLAFQTAFGNEDPNADLAAPFGVLNLFDFLAFQTAFGNGC